MSQTAPSHHEYAHHHGDVEYFDPNDTLVTALRRGIANSQDLLLERQGGDRLILVGSRGEYFMQFADEKAFFTSPVATVVINILDMGDSRVPPADVAGRPVDELMWKAAFYASRGRLMRECNPVDMVELAAWPNLTRLPHTENSPRIAALLSRHPTSVTFAARVLKITPPEIYQFYSAASCAGLARPINRAVEEPSLAPHRHQSLLSVLLKRLSSQ